jgi:UDP-N-acetylmuramate: L-alanyl-gamma-D-glutamyl-meso-diaminopimelate ligase
LQLDGSQFEVFHQEQNGGLIDWSLIGSHNINNALAAIAAANHIGIDPMDSVSALNHFKGVKRRLELRGVVQDIHVYDDFAHHPTAISATLSALRNRVGSERIFAVLEFGSNTMRQDHHKNTIAWSLANADHVILLKPTSSNWDFEELLAQFEQPVELFDQVDDIVNYLSNRCKSGDHVLCMSNMLFGDIHQKLLASLQTKAIVNQCKMNLLP